MMLLEVLIVVAITSLIAGGVGVAAYEYFGKAKVTAATTSARSLRGSVKHWRSQAGETRCPTMSDLLSSGDLDEDSARVDPWGRPWRIDCEGARVAVGSDGPDRTENTGDDIRVPANEREPEDAPTG